ncbi:MAG TPA: hypothetical protein VFJ59_01615 [Pseudolabrys sp.]|nr:hypothetical protein [Pseudolabrys sp.]
MDTSLWSAGQHTHLKIVFVSLIASIALVAVGINARVPDSGATTVETADIVVKAGKLKAYTDIGRANIR